MSVRELKPGQEWQFYADPLCRQCHGEGHVPSRDPIYDGWKWCVCAKRNKRIAIELEQA